MRSPRVDVLGDPGHVVECGRPVRQRQFEAIVVLHFERVVEPVRVQHQRRRVVNVTAHERVVEERDVTELPQKRIDDVESRHGQLLVREVRDGCQGPAPCVPQSFCPLSHGTAMVAQYPRAVSVQLIALLTNVALALLKFVVGSIAGSRALIADAFNSAGDVVATGIAWVAFRYGLKPPDEDHHYGHQNAEALAGLVLGAMLCATGVFICIEGVLGIVQAEAPTIPGAAAMWAAGVTAAVKLVLYRVSLRVGRRTNSPTLLASARDHGADVLSGTVALVGIFIARNGFPELDAIAGIVIGVYIFYLSFEPLKSNTDILMHAAPPELAERARAAASRIADIHGVNQVRVQPIGGHYRMDMSVAVDGSLSVDSAHDLAHEVEDAVREQLDGVIEVHVHVEPAARGEPATGAGLRTSLRDLLDPNLDRTRPPP